MAVTVLEAGLEDAVKPGSRAIYVHGATLRLLEAVCPGLGRRIADRGILWPTKRTFWRGRQVFARTYPPPPPAALPPFTSLPQAEFERVLVEACVAAGVDIVWGHRVSRLSVTARGAGVTDGHERVWPAAYVVGADGAHSTVRRDIGVALAGNRSRNSYVVVDVDEAGADPRPLERVFHYEHPAVGGRNVLLVPFAGGWRVDLQCRAEDDVAAFGGERSGAWLAAVMGEAAAARVRWVSTYQFLQMVAVTLVDAQRRVLLIGEAAHLFAPFGARGLNSGVADAMAAATAVSTALGAGGAEAARSAVEAFAASRMTAARRNRWAAGRALAATESDHLWNVTRRRLAGALAPRVGRAAAWLDAAPYGPRLRTARGRGGGY